MASSARSTTTYKQLMGLVNQGATGHLSVGAGSAELTMYLLDGHVVAARASDDTAVLIERMAIAGHLREERARQLYAMQSMSASVLGRGMVDPILGLLLEEADHSGFDDILQTRFEENVARFVGHRGRPRFDDGAMPWAYNIQIGHDSKKLIRQAAEVWALSQRVDDNTLLRAGPTAPEDEVSRALVGATRTAPMRVADMVLALGLPDVVGRALIARAVSDGLLLAEGLPDVVIADDDDDDEPAPSTPQSSQTPREPDDMDAFSGAGDRVRGGGNAGTFVAEHLDRVEIDLGDEPERRKDKAYSAPTLGEDEARDKLSVANDVLGRIADALESELGQGRGRMAIQLLVEGRPRAYVSLFDDIPVEPDGTLPSGRLLANLRKRPETEQRTLLRQGLLDLLDRALDKAADELPEDAFEDVLGRVMGYRQRLGL